MRFPRAKRSAPGVALRCTLLCSLAFGSMGRAADPEISLPEAALQTLEANLDLRARRHELAAAEQEIGLTRSALLPEVNVGARLQVLDDDRSDSERGNNEEKSLLLAAELNQVLYDETDLSTFQIQKFVYAGQVQELESFRLGLIQEAANAFLELDRAARVLEIQQRNRELTRKNLETSRSRIAAGWSSEREILRWESQLATNDTDVRAAEVALLQSRFELNRVRSHSPETPLAARRATPEEYGFAYARAAVARAVAGPDSDRRLRDFFVPLGLRRSPELAILDASIAATERQLTARRRAFWAPSLNFNASVDRLATESSNSSDFNETEWTFKGVLLFPLLQGGAKFAGFQQAAEALASARTQRRATAQSVEQSIRAAFAQASGSFESIGFTVRQRDAASRNFELVEASYTLGIASILALLDAQSQLLAAELSLANATVGFLRDLVAAEREISYYAFLEPPGDVEALLDDLEGRLEPQP